MVNSRSFTFQKHIAKSFSEDRMLDGLSTCNMHINVKFVEAKELLAEWVIILVAVWNELNTGCLILSRFEYNAAAELVKEVQFAEVEGMWLSY